MSPEAAVGTADLTYLRLLARGAACDGRDHSEPGHLVFARARIRKWALAIWRKVTGPSATPANPAARARRLNRQTFPPEYRRAVGEHGPFRDG